MSIAVVYCGGDGTCTVVVRERDVRMKRCGHSLTWLAVAFTGGGCKPWISPSEHAARLADLLRDTDVLDQEIPDSDLADSDEGDSDAANSGETDPIPDTDADSDVGDTDIVLPPDDCDGEDADGSLDPVCPSVAETTADLNAEGSIFAVGMGFGTTLFGGYNNSDGIGDVGGLYAGTHGNSVMAYTDPDPSNPTGTRTFGLPARGMALARASSGAGVAYVTDTGLHTQRSESTGPPMVSVLVSTFTRFDPLRIARFVGPLRFVTAGGTGIYPFLAATVDWNNGSSDTLRGGLVTNGVTSSRVAAGTVRNAWGSVLAVAEGPAHGWLFAGGVNDDGSSFVDVAELPGAEGPWPGTIAARPFLADFEGAISAIEACDVDGDGVDEVVLLQPAGSLADAVEAWVYPVPDGGDSGTDPLALLQIALPNVGMGGSVSLACTDFDGNGVGDVVVGAAPGDAPPAGIARFGTVHVFLGFYGGDSRTSLDEHDASYILSGSAAMQSIGYAVAGIPDRNGDGYDEIGVGMPGLIPSVPVSDLSGGFSIVSGRSYQ
jgi:hypothetical protein